MVSYISKCSEIQFESFLHSQHLLTCSINIRSEKLHEKVDISQHDNTADFQALHLSLHTLLLDSPLLP